MGALYRVEKEIKELELSGAKKRLYRLDNSTPVVDEYFSWLRAAYEKSILLPSSPYTKAANYALSREAALRVFLDNPDVPIDTNMLEAGLRPIPMGRKNWMFCWTEVGAIYTGYIQSLIQSCRMQGIDPFIYLVDVLQRIETHKMKDIHLLTPRLWKENFADTPIKDTLSTIAQ